MARACSASPPPASASRWPAPRPCWPSSATCRWPCWSAAWCGSRRWPAIDPAWIHGLQQSILDLHADWPRLALATLWHTGSWLLGAVEIAGVLALLGHPVSLADALVIESLAQALRNVGFMLPGALAVQEGAIIGAAALVGVPPGAALAVALVRRTREVCLSLPGLIAWQRAETRAMR
ncbi:lysylphosphatidylglycerol synthase domain-containing protein [Paeniroseomonas aquatica]|uniref:lysylphosphatidylglycerol synthase domain-containing protein n=1 Tax=Paeniroseomonas aquatica TaxID=373043 RepID=UPI00362069B8